MYVYTVNDNTLLKTYPLETDGAGTEYFASIVESRTLTFNSRDAWHRAAVSNCFDKNGKKISERLYSTRAKVNI